MTVEAILTRELKIRFIDARALVTEAKLILGITGYAQKEQENELIAEAIKVFQAKPKAEQASLQQANDDLESIKSSHHSQGGRDDLSSSSHSSGSLNTSNHGKSPVQANRKGPLAKLRSLSPIPPANRKSKNKVVSPVRARSLSPLPPSGRRSMEKDKTMVELTA